VESENGVEGIAETYRWLYEDWMPESGYELALPYDFEQYDSKGGEADESGEGTEVITVWVPIVERPPEEDVVEAEYGEYEEVEE